MRGEMTVGDWKMISPKLSTGITYHGEYQYVDPVQILKSVVLNTKLKKFLTYKLKR